MTKYPNHLDDSGKEALQKLYAEIEERTKKEEAPKKTDNYPAIRKVFREYTNPFGVTILELDGGDGYIAKGYSYPSKQWPYDKEVVNQGLIRLLISTDSRLIHFWNQFSSIEKPQSQFIFRLQTHISMWAFNKTLYETTLSNFKRKIKAVKIDIKNLIIKLQESHGLSDIADDEIHKALDDRYYDVFEEKAHSWNLWDEKPLRLDDLLTRILQRFEKELQRESSSWHPKKMEGKSADKIFLIRAVHRLMMEFFNKASHVLVADMVSILLNETITEEDVRKNLVEANRKIPAPTHQ